MVMTTRDKARVETSEGRHYYDEAGRRYVSVTTAIGGGLPKNQLGKWASKYAAEHAASNLERFLTMRKSDVIAEIKDSPWAYARARADLGGRVHEAVENYLLNLGGGQPENELAPYLLQFGRFLSEWQPKVEAAEMVVYSERYGYAGTLDSIMVIDGERVVLDVKTGSGVYREASVQLAMYRAADFVQVNGERIAMPETDGGRVLHLQPKNYRLIPISCGEEELEIGLAALKIHNWNGDATIGRALKRTPEPQWGNR